MIFRNFNSIISDIAVTVTNQDRRKADKIKDTDIYNAENIDAFIQKERRHDELDRLREIKSQKRLWVYTVSFCALLNLILIGLAIWGAIEP